MPATRSPRTSPRTSPHASPNSTAGHAKREESEELPDSTGWSASLYNKTASFVYSSPFVAPVLDLLNAQPGEKILDVGCGSAEVSLDIQRVVSQQSGGVVVGMDASESMIVKAKANGLKHAFVCDAHDLIVPDEIYAWIGNGSDARFDAAFSNATLHWCKRDPLAVLQGVKRVLKPEGRFVAEMGGFMNCIGVRSALYAAVRSRGYDPALYDPWYFPSMEDYVKLLVTAGFEPTHMSLTPRITPLPAGLFEWLRLFARNSFLRIFDDAEAAKIIEEVVENCRVDCQDAGGNWAMTYMRLRFSAVLKK
ncbi:cyclopropane-fatty-acyl-phospholipid synthase [Ephemerocybe angulata]|uniref:Cyclopropane-fatty-acyl-phospholipid synthase n=1 Tax=Ephemerocybe angulata TaxID=980116 RepID=A0A8H6I502_9AGAR|nr:cyclopropane-fatty-acyl-phospholipid synthase [Tulosesus angulatus]